MTSKTLNGISYKWHNKNSKSLPIVMLHGHGADHQAFNDLLDKIDHPLILLDLPGFGRSKMLKINSVEAIASKVALILEQLEIKNYAAIGHSFGTIVGLKLAENDKKCQKLVLLNALPVFKPIIENFYHIAGKTFTSIPEYISDSFLNSRIYKTTGYMLHARVPLGRSYLGEILSPSIVYPDFKSRAWRESWHSIHEVDQFRIATNVKCETLIMHGDKDSLTNSDNVELFFSFFAKAKLVRFKNGGHIMHREMTRPVALEITKFLDEPFRSEILRIL